MVDDLDEAMEKDDALRAERLAESLWADAGRGRTAWFAFLMCRSGSKPQCPRTRVQLALARALEGDIMAGAAGLAQVSREDLGSHGYCVLAMARAEAQQLERAVETLARAVRKNPDSALVHWQQAQLFLRQGREYAAQVVARQAVAILPTLQNALLVCLERDLSAGEFKLARLCRSVLTPSAGQGCDSNLMRLDAQLSLVEQILALNLAGATPADLVAATFQYARGACQGEGRLTVALQLLRTLAAGRYEGVCGGEIGLYVLRLLLILGDKLQLHQYVSQVEWRAWIHSFRLTVLGGELITLAGAPAIGEELFWHAVACLVRTRRAGEPVSEVARRRVDGLLRSLQQVGRLQMVSLRSSLRNSGDADQPLPGAVPGEIPAGQQGVDR